MRSPGGDSGDGAARRARAAARRTMARTRDQARAAERRAMARRRGQARTALRADRHDAGLTPVPTQAPPHAPSHAESDRDTRLLGAALALCALALAGMGVVARVGREWEPA